MNDDVRRGASEESDSGPRPLERAQPAEVIQEAEVVDPAESTEPAASALSVAFHHREGPLPAPAELQAYYDIAPEVGSSIVQMAHTAATHRHRMESRSFWLIIVFALCVTTVMLAVIAAAGWVAAEVSAVGGVVVLLASPTALLWALVSRAVRRIRRGPHNEAEDAESTEAEDAESTEAEDEESSVS